MQKKTNQYIKRGAWAEAYATLSRMEQRILVAINYAGMLTPIVAANQCNCTAQVADHVFRRLFKAGLIEVVDQPGRGARSFQTISPELIEYLLKVDRSTLYRDLPSETAKSLGDLIRLRVGGLADLGLVRGSYKAEVDGICRSLEKCIDSIRTNP